MQASDSENIGTILRYFALAPDSDDAQRVTGLTGPAIAGVLRGQATPDAATRRHIDVVAQLVRSLGDARGSAT